MAFTSTIPLFLEVTLCTLLHCRPPPRFLTLPPRRAYKPASRDTGTQTTGAGRSVANHKSAEKRNRQTQTRTAVNGARVSRIRTFLKKVEVAIASGDQTAARDAFRAAQPELQRGAVKGVVHPNLVARKLSRLSARIKALAPQA